MLAAAAPPEPYAIFARARSYWSSQAYPAQLSYLVTISGTAGGSTITNTYESSVNTLTGDISVHATSREEAAHPYVPHGVTVKASIHLGYAGKATLGAAPSVEPNDTIGVTKTIRVSKMQQFDLLGVPVLSPAYGFGLAAARLPDRSALPPLPGLKTIASVSVTRRDYDIRYLDDAAIGGKPCYHLQLTPLRDPSKYRLREIWLAEDTYAPQQALIQGNFTAGPSPRLPWMIHFTTTGSVTYVASETAQSPVTYLGRTYTNVTITFGDIAAVTIPDSLSAFSLFRTSGDVLREPLSP
jgi:hypothetical protein